MNIYSWTFSEYLQIYEEATQQVYNVYINTYIGMCACLCTLYKGNTIIRIERKHADKSYVI